MIHKQAHASGVDKHAQASGVVPLDFYLKAKGSSGGLNEKSPPQVTYVNTWSTPSGGDWGGAALLEEVHHWGRVRIDNLTPLPVHSLCSLGLVEDVILQLSAARPPWTVPLEPYVKINFFSISCFV